jgi:hypothetical protein
MNGAGARRKGSQGELEFAAALHDLIGIRLARRLTQARGGGHDLELEEGASGPVAEALARLAIECKRYATAPPASLAAWWSQATRQAEAAGLWPALAYRPDRQPWRVRLPLAALWSTFNPWDDVGYTVDLPLLAFAAVLREGLILPRSEGGPA